jgi:ribonuclease BN (tRNA processing enzyme)
MNHLQLLCLGTGDAFSALYYSSCFALESGGHWLLVDCPHPIRKIAREGALAAGVAFDVSKIDAIVLTHLHGDHVSGLECLGYYFRYILGRSLVVYTHADVAQALWSGVLSGSMEWVIEKPGALPRQRALDDFFDLHLLPDGDEETKAGPFRLTCRKTIHSVPTIALRCTAAGRCLGYSADTMFDPTLIDWLADAHVIIHEANSAFMHTNLADLLTVRPEVREKLRITHYPDTLDLATAPLPPMRQGTLMTI